MIVDLHPALILMSGAVLAAVLRGLPRRIAMVAVPLLGLINVARMEIGTTMSMSFLGYELETLRADKLSLIFTYLFHIAAVIVGFYSLHLKDKVQLISGFLYAGSAVGAVLAGDLVTLFVFWELMAVTSVFQIWARRTERASNAGLRYLLLQVASGLLLLAGTTFLYQTRVDGGFTGNPLAFDHMKLDSAGTWMIFLAIGIKCAFPLFHTWLTDAYPEATPTGTVFLASFTTKVAVYALARGFAGADILVPIGTVMAMFPIFYAVIENDLRRVLGYSMINQIGFMVVGIGIGTPWGINGAVAHAFNDVIFKGLLMMSMGAVLFRTGRINGSDLGGLYKSMPWTCGFCIVGACSISAFPLFSGFVSKAMVMSAAGEQGMLWVWLMLLFASAGVFHHAGIKIPFFAFFAHDSGIRTKEAPWNMLVAMGIAAVLCVATGSPWGYPVLYGLLPETPEQAYHPYSLTHIVTQTQLLFFSALAFAVLTLTKIYPPELRSVNLDVDWFYRKGGTLFVTAMDKSLNGINRLVHAFTSLRLERLFAFFCEKPGWLFVKLQLACYALCAWNPDQLDAKEKELYQNSRLGTATIGIAGLFAVVMFAWFFRLLTS